MSDEEYYQLQLQQWNKFFSCCLQYQQQDNTPVACFSDNTTGMVTVIKKVCFWKVIFMTIYAESLFETEICIYVSKSSHHELTKALKYFLLIKTHV